MKKILNKSMMVDTNTGEITEDLKNKSETAVEPIPPVEFIPPVALPPKNEDISVDILNRSVELVSEVFDLKNKGYVLVNFDDKFESLKVVLSNPEFEVTVKVKNTFEVGLRKV